ncbi:MAG: glycosyl transferase [Planctomycetota bacterium]
MRIVLLVTDLQPGGTPLRIAAIARGLREAGDEVVVGCLAGRGPVSEELERDGIATFACGARRPWHFGAIWRLCTHLRRIRPDIVHSTLLHANVAARLVCDWLRIPLLTSTATIEVERKWHLRLERWTAGWDEGHIVNGPSLAEHVIREFGRPRERVFIVPPFLDRVPTMIDRAEARQRLNLPPDAPVVGWFGRFDPVKRLDLILDCAIELRNTDFHFVLAGDGPLHSSIEARIGLDRLAERVLLPGWLADPGVLLSAADVMIFPSLTEGLPNAVLQSMWAGVPVIASDIAAHRDLSGDERRLYLVSGRDAVLTALQNVLSRGESQRELTQRAREWACDLNRDNAIERLRSVLAAARGTTEIGDSR